MFQHVNNSGKQRTNGSNVLGGLWKTKIWFEVGRGKILLMEEILLASVDMVEIPLFTSVLYIPGGCLGFLNHQGYDQALLNALDPQRCFFPVLSLIPMQFTSF